MRCFVALDVSDATRALATNIRTCVTALDRDWRSEKWVARENLHVTLAFLGDVTDEQANLLATSLFANTVVPFSLGAPTLSAVPNAGSASMLWIRYLEGIEECHALATFVRECAVEHGIVIEDPVSRLTPHVTLVRSRRARVLSPDALNTARRLTDVASDQVVSVSSVRVFSSSLGQAGPAYSELAQIPLRGPGTQ